ncbi:RNA polymerase II C-terminal domain phosphatase-like 4, partial [Bienertia sinuspersici]
MVKSRPYVQNFLEEANKLFCLSIATRARRLYALAMATILDPRGCYFANRGVSRDDLRVGDKRKRLEAVLGHETTKEGALANALKVLKQVHTMFSDPNQKDDLARRDVRKELAEVMKVGKIS